jgi:hypothetical protein
MIFQAKLCKLAKSYGELIVRKTTCTCFLNCRSPVQFRPGSPTQIKYNPIDNACRIFTPFHHVSRPFTNGVGETSGNLFSLNFNRSAQPTRLAKSRRLGGFGNSGRSVFCFWRSALAEAISKDVVRVDN